MLGETNGKAANVLPCEYVNIMLITNQPSHEDVLGAVVNVSYDGFSEDYVWEGKELTLEIPEGMEYTVSFSEVDSYASPSAVTNKAVADNARDIEGLYQTEAVVVSADQGTVTGFEVTVTDSSTGAVIAVQTTAMETYKIPFGISYSVIAGDIEGYLLPDEQSFIASLKDRSVRVVYEKYTHMGTKDPTNGVWIQDTEGYFYTEDEWDESYTADCVAVITSDCRFGIALTIAEYTKRIDEDSGRDLGKYLTAISDETQAKADYDGATNTANIMKMQSGTDYAAGWCNAFTFPSGKNGFLPSLGQMWAAYSNKDAVDSALVKAGGTACAEAAYGYWTSTF